MKTVNGSWKIDLGGIAYREAWELGKMLVELGDKGTLNGRALDMTNLEAYFNAQTGEVFLTDGEHYEFGVEDND